VKCRFAKGPHTSPFRRIARQVFPHVGSNTPFLFDDLKNINRRSGLIATDQGMGARVGSAFLSKISFEDQSEAAQRRRWKVGDHTRLIEQLNNPTQTNDEIPEIAESSRAKRDGRGANPPTNESSELDHTPFVSMTH
jgi:hypothetical protein